MTFAIGKQKHRFLARAMLIEVGIELHEIRLQAGWLPCTHVHKLQNLPSICCFLAESRGNRFPISTQSLVASELLHWGAGF